MKAYFEETIKETTPSMVAFVRVGDQDAVEVKHLLDKLEKEFGDRVNFRRADVSYNHHIASRYNLNRFPVFIMFKQGEELMRESGEKTFTELEDLVKRAL